MISTIYKLEFTVTAKSTKSDIKADLTNQEMEELEDFFFYKIDNAVDKEQNTRPSCCGWGVNFIATFDNIVDAEDAQNKLRGFIKDSCKSLFEV